MPQEKGMSERNVAESPVLIALSGNLQGTRWVLEKAETVIGRTADCEIVVPSRQVSRRHARLLRTESGFVVEDLGSKNGTHLNGHRIDRPRLLQDGDVLQIALALELVYVGREATMPLSQAEAMELGLGRLRMGPSARRLWIEGKELRPALSPRQYRLLQVLYENMGRVVSRDEIVAEVWAEESDTGVSEQAIDALARRLRERLAEIDPRHEYIVTVRGHGFRLDNPL
jgi:DNA-binding response OmpR family regulator